MAVSYEAGLGDAAVSSVGARSPAAASSRAKQVFHFGGGTADGDGTLRDLLGGKGAGLAEMSRLGIRVPPGFTISTDACKAFFKADSVLPDDLHALVRDGIRRVGNLVGADFGDPDRPLLLSVRSGARVSMPGMMDTVLNLGMNDGIAKGLARRTGRPRFAANAHYRFVVMFADVVLGVARTRFDAALEQERRRLARSLGVAAGIPTAELERRIPDSMLDEAALDRLLQDAKRIVRTDSGAPFPEDPADQLDQAIAAVFRSWFNPRAKVYRAMHGIPEDIGTACTVQAMVFGNLGDDSGTGVAFTRDPSTGEKRFFGEWLPNAQGEDVVAGTRTPHPVSRGTSDDGNALEAKMPGCYAELVAVGAKLERHLKDAQDLEFTIQQGTLYLLQCRSAKRTGRAAVRTAVEMVAEGLITERDAVLRVEPSALDPLLHPTLDPTAPRRLLTRGLPASPGAASGQVVFTANEAEELAGQGVAVILVRADTSAEDIHGMKAARGIVTARGGMTSHAAVVARGMGKSCVTGCSAMSVSYDQRAVTIAAANPPAGAPSSVIVRSGDTITLDGATGEVFWGAVPTVPATPSPELLTLMGWADAARRLRVRANADTPHDASTARSFGAEGIGLCRTEHMFFDDERISAVREMILAETSEARRRALAKLLPHQREDFVGVFRAMAGLPVTVRLLDPPLHEFLPHDDATLAHLAETIGVSLAVLQRRNADLAEHNPMLGHRGVRLAVTFPEIYEMQIRALLEAGCVVTKQGVAVDLEIMIPLTLARRELEICRELVDRTAREVFAEQGCVVPFAYGTMIELPRAVIVSGELAEVAEFMSFGTNDLTQTALGISRDDAGTFLGSYVDAGIFPEDPFRSIDRDGVGALLKMSKERARATRPGIRLGVCGEHGGDPASIAFFDELGLDYVSCSPFRVPGARLAAAQAALRVNQTPLFRDV